MNLVEWRAALLLLNTTIFRSELQTEFNYPSALGAHALNLTRLWIVVYATRPGSTELCIDSPKAIGNQTIYSTFNAIEIKVLPLESFLLDCKRT